MQKTELWPQDAAWEHLALDKHITRGVATLESLWSKLVWPRIDYPSAVLWASCSHAGWAFWGRTPALGVSSTSPPKEYPPSLGTIGHSLLSFYLLSTRHFCACHKLGEDPQHPPLCSWATVTSALPWKHKHSNVLAPVVMTPLTTEPADVQGVRSLTQHLTRHLPLFLTWFMESLQWESLLFHSELHSYG